MDVLLITPPLVQPNTPYAATPLLTAWLRAQGLAAGQCDLSLEMLLRLFCPGGIEVLKQSLIEDDAGEAADFIMQAGRYRETIEGVMRFLQGRDPDSAFRLCRRGELPEGPRLAKAWEELEALAEAFGTLGTDLARHLASLYLDDIADAARVADPLFGFSRYAADEAVYLPELAPLHGLVTEHASIFTCWMDELAAAAVEKHNPRLVALTAPFPGTLFGALKIGYWIKRNRPDIHVALGGGYCMTELVGMKDLSVFDFVDSINLNSGPAALERLAKYVLGSGRREDLVDTLMPGNGELQHLRSPATPPPHGSLPAPTYDGLDLDRYFGMVETLNPVRRLWSDGKWNRLMLAHGCCWGRCAFCDTELECISRYDPASAKTICDWIEAVAAETGHSGFHFADEAMPAKLVEEVCDEILARKLQCTWWGNIRFEKAFTPRLTAKMASAGCVAVAGGLETASDRTLRLMRKGTDLKTAKRVMTDLTAEGILVHAYLMHGFPTQTPDETREAEQTVQRFCEEGILHSFYWHRFALTAHSPIARNPERYGIRLTAEPETVFARNEIPYEPIH